MSVMERTERALTHRLTAAGGNQVPAQFPLSRKLAAQGQAAESTPMRKVQA